MGLEAGVTKLSDLDSTWPLSTDLRHYGDDHLRNIKIAVRSLLPGGVTEQLSHADMLLRGTNTHAQIDTHIADTTKHLPGFVDRGDPAAYDKTSFTQDGNWTDWDLSAVVPANAKAVLIKIYLFHTTTANIGIDFRKNGNANSIAISRVLIGTANVEENETLVVACDTSRVVEYRCSGDGAMSIYGTVLGWFF